jgi:alginate O-acetyltransferase complex protein AlgI
MVFSSILFLSLFLPFTISLYFLVGKTFRNIFLLFASLIFYAWGERLYLLIMLVSIVLIIPAHCCPVVCQLKYCNLLL